MTIEFLDTVPVILREPLALWWERAGVPGALHETYGAVPERLRRELPRVAAGSEFVAAALIQDPSALAWFARHSEPPMASTANDDYEKRAAAAAAVPEAKR